MKTTLAPAWMAKQFVQAGEQCGITSTELLASAGVDPEQLAERTVPMSTLEELVRALVRHTGDPGIGLRMARDHDLRSMGFLGYALMSSLTLRQRLQLHLRYQQLSRSNAQMTFRVEGDSAILEATIKGIAHDVAPVFVDAAVGISCIQHAKHVASERPELELWMPYRELPHHRELRAMVIGPVHFDAGFIAFKFDAAHLDRRLPGDPYLLELAVEQLESQLGKLRDAWDSDTLTAVRSRLGARLSGDSSLERVASDLNMSARTLRRQLQELGTSFQKVLEEVRLERAIDYLSDANQGIKQVAAKLGYSDPANFRRAFRRWTGSAPTDYRGRPYPQTQQHAQARADSNGSRLR